jgi:hypothetical protein
MSISLSTNLLLVDASAQAGTIILPNPSTLAGRILYIRDVAGTINNHSTVSIVTETTHFSVATMTIPSSFITLAAAPISNVQYHVIGGNYFEHLAPKTGVLASTISTSHFFITSCNYSNVFPNLSSVTTNAMSIDSYSTTSFQACNLSFSSNFTLTAADGKLYLNNVPWQGKNFAIQTPQGVSDPEFPYTLISTGVTFPLFWFDGKDSNTMYTGLTTNTKVAPGGKVVRWNSKPSTLQLYAWNLPTEGCGTLTDSSGVLFPANGGFIFSNLNPAYAEYPYAMPLANFYMIYFVATKRLDSSASIYYFGRPGYPGAAPAILTNYPWTSLYSNGNLSTSVTSACNACMWYSLASEFIPLTMNQDNGFNIVTIKKSVLPENPVLELYYNGSNVFQGYSAESPPGGGYGPPQLTVLGDYQDAHTGPNAYYGDAMFYLDTLHSRSQQQQLEGWLAARWNIRNKLPLTHPYYSASN